MFYILVAMSQCNSDDDCNGGICEYQDYADASFCTGCPPNVTGPYCDCEQLCFIVSSIENKW